MREFVMPRRQWMLWPPVIGLWLLLAPVTLAGDTADAAAMEVQKALRDTTKNEALGGSLIEAHHNAGQLQLKGYVLHEEQRKAVLKQAKKLVAENPDAKKSFTNGITATDLKLICPELQRLFAENTEENRQDRDILRQTRLDAVGYNKDLGTLTFEGECIYLGAPMPDLRKGPSAPGPADKKGAPVPDPADKARDLAPVLIRTIERYLPVKRFKLQVNTDKVTLLKEDSPVRALLQRLVSGAKLDEVLLTARYDGDGTLQLEGIVGSEEYPKKIDEFFAEKSGAVPGLRPATTPAKGPRWVRTGVRTVAWPLTVKKLQASLAAEPALVLRQIRLDRSYYRYSPKGHLELYCEGISCGRNTGDFLSWLGNEANRLWAEVDIPVRSNVSDSNIAIGREPDVTALPAQIVQSRTMDGIRLDGGSYFDADGALCLQGLWLGPKQEQELRALADKILSTLKIVVKDEKDEKTYVVNLVARGLSLKDLKLSRTDVLLARLREWTAENLEECWLDRLLFKGLDLELQCTVLAADLDKVTKQFKRMYAEHVGKVAPPQAEPDKKIEAEPDKKIEAEPDKKIEPAVRESQPRVEPTKKLETTFSKKMQSRLITPGTQGDGILIDRCYYDPSGEFVISGLLDNDKQKAIIEALVKQLASEGQWISASGKDLTYRRLRVVALQPMLDALAQVMPAYPALDGILLERRAYHQTDKKLVLTCRVVGGRPNDDTRKRVQGLLLEHHTWKIRAAAGVSFDVLEPTQPANRDRAEAAIRYALQYLDNGNRDLARREVGVALVHDPEDSTAWFLRAGDLLRQGQTVFAERDLRRVAQLERDTRGGQSITRRKRVMNLQGDERVRLEELLLKVTADVARARPPLSLKDVPSGE